MDHGTILANNHSAAIFRGRLAGEVLLLRLTTGEVAIATYQGSDGALAQLISPRVLKLEKMHLVFTDFMMAGDAKSSCDLAIAHIVAVGKPTGEAEEGYRSLTARL